jgi:hypothetical protein
MTHSFDENERLFLMDSCGQEQCLATERKEGVMAEETLGGSPESECPGFTPVNCRVGEGSRPFVSIHTQEAKKPTSLTGLL